MTFNIECDIQHHGVTSMLFTFIIPFILLLCYVGIHAKSQADLIRFCLRHKKIITACVGEVL